MPLGVDTEGLLAGRPGFQFDDSVNDDEEDEATTIDKLPRATGRTANGSRPEIAGVTA